MENLRICFYVNFQELGAMLLASNHNRYGGEEYEEATYGGMVVMKMNKIKKRFA